MPSTPIINQIAANIEATINTITTANGYNCNLTADRLAQLPPEPVKGLAMLRREPPTLVDWHQVPAGWVRWEQPFTIFVAFPPDTDQSPPLDDQLAIFTADITKALRVDLSRGGLAIYTEVAEPDDITPAEGTYYAAAKVTVFYGTKENDPYTGMSPI